MLPPISLGKKGTQTETQSSQMFFQHWQGFCLRGAHKVHTLAKYKCAVSFLGGKLVNTSFCANSEWFFRVCFRLPVQSLFMRRCRWLLYRSSAELLRELGSTVLSYTWCKEMLNWLLGLWRHGTLSKGYMRHKDHSLSSCTRKGRQVVSNAQLSTLQLRSKLCTGGGFLRERNSYSSFSEAQIIWSSLQNTPVKFSGYRECAACTSQALLKHTLISHLSSPRPEHWLQGSFCFLGWDYSFLEWESRDDSSPKCVSGATVLWACCPQKSEESKNAAHSTAGWEEIFNILFLNSPLS